MKDVMPKRSCAVVMLEWLWPCEWSCVGSVHCGSSHCSCEWPWEGSEHCGSPQPSSWPWPRSAWPWPPCSSWPCSPQEWPPASWPCSSWPCSACAWPSAWWPWSSWAASAAGGSGSARTVLSGTRPKEVWNTLAFSFSAPTTARVASRRSASARSVLLSTSRLAHSTWSTSRSGMARGSSCSAPRAGRSRSRLPSLYSWVKLAASTTVTSVSRRATSLSALPACARSLWSWPSWMLGAPGANVTATGIGSEMPVLSISR
mmetsp:Transcript_54126/g.167558  ORF Transcript_54126/g.167558 Transcript_54126/m.167558 type:complete len:259 (-) Transcript_54126:248-1024(-)